MTEFIDEFLIIWGLDAQELRDIDHRHILYMGIFMMSLLTLIFTIMTIVAYIE